jgi:hypothetical protein
LVVCGSIARIFKTPLEIPIEKEAAALLVLCPLAAWAKCTGIEIGNISNQQDH